MFRSNHSKSRNNPILITGAHRSGTTWVGRIVGESFYTYYLGELFNPKNPLSQGLFSHWFEYITDKNQEKYRLPLERLLNYQFKWLPQHRQGLRKWLPSGPQLLRHTRAWSGWPRPLIKDPIAVMSAKWLSDRFNVSVVCLVRHPAAFVTSLLKTNWRFDFSEFSEQPLLMEEQLFLYRQQIKNPPTDPIEEGALLWLCINHVLTDYKEANPDWSLWKLENITTEPQQAFETIFAQLDLPYTSRIKKLIQKTSNPANPTDAPETDPHSIVRNSVAAQQRWKQILSESEVKRIRQVTEPIAHQYYTDDEW